jgi:hypothetical protein
MMMVVVTTATSSSGNRLVVVSSVTGALVRSTSAPFSLGIGQPHDKSAGCLKRANRIRAIESVVLQVNRAIARSRGGEGMGHISTVIVSLYPHRS